MLGTVALPAAGEGDAEQKRSSLSGDPPVGF